MRIQYDLSKTDVVRNKWSEVTNGGLDVGDIHTDAVIRVCTDDKRAVLHVERKIGDVDVARRLEDASRLPVKLSVVPQHDADALEVWNQFLGAVATTSQENGS